MTHRLCGFCSLLVCVALLLASQASAATYYVSLSGSDANSCATATNTTQSNQKRTIAAGVACATTPGDTVLIHGGTYTGPDATIDSQGHTVASGSGSGTTYTSPITISGVSGETAILKPDNGVGGIRLYTAVSYIIIQDLEIDLSNSVLPVTGEAVILYTCHHIRLQRLNVHHGLGFGIHTGVDTPFIEIRDSQIHDFGYVGDMASDGHCLYVSGSDNTYERNDVYNCRGYGFHIYNNGPSNLGLHADPSRTVTRNNRIHNTGAHASGEAGIVVAWGSDNAVYSNVVYSNSGGIQAYTSSSNTLIYNNTIVNNSPYAGVFLQFYASAPVIRNNIIFGNAVAIDDQGGTGTPVQDHNLLTDPTFTGTGTDVFALQATSTARDTGATIALVTTDILGVARPVNSLYDIGAYEYNVVSPPVGTRLAWDEPDTDLTTVQAYVYTLYVDARPGVVLAATCSGSSSPFPCEAPLPRLQPGVRSLVLIAANANGMGVSADALSYTSTTGLIPIIDHNRKQQR